MKLLLCSPNVSVFFEIYFFNAELVKNLLRISFSFSC